MALYIDSADRPAVEELLATGAFTGITTNPTILDRAGLRQDAGPEVYGWAVAAGARQVFLQARGATAEEIASQGRTLASIGERAVVKIAATRAGVEAAGRMRDEGIETLLTAVYHPGQALLAAAVGAGYIAPYVGRMDDASRDGQASTAAMVEILRGTPVRVLAASVRSIEDVVRLARAGVHDFALAPALCEQLLSDMLTVEAAAAFEAIGR